MVRIIMDSEHAERDGRSQEAYDAMVERPELRVTYVKTKTQTRQPIAIAFTGDQAELAFHTYPGLKMCLCIAIPFCEVHTTIADCRAFFEDNE